jgi:small subunit ribosomal protein S6
MRRYETITIFDPDLSKEERKPILDRISELIPQQDGFLAIIDEWGSKKLAYEIKKKSHGYYVRIDYCGTGALIDEMERFFRIDDRVLKYMTVLLDEEADIESIKNEIALAESQAKQAALSSDPEPETISEETAGSDTKADSEAEPAAPGDETESKPPSEITAEAEVDTESEAETAAPGDEIESKPLSEITVEAEADAESEAEPAAPGDEIESKPPSEKTADAEVDTESEAEGRAGSPKRRTRI